ncbi:MAG: hypothetical protein E6K13_03555 [Methanobacteriota archaeon]|nr:MAG: hypothetical protein E6K13_03555 [Euryarchaeota archaeon]
MAEEQLRFAIAFVVGIGPAIMLMWLSLRRFAYPMAPKSLFDDRRVFFAFAVGIGFGAVSSSLTYSISTSVPNILVPLIAAALFEESFKLAYLNLKSFRGRFDTTFYGVSLGVGSGGALAMASVFNANPTLLSASEVPAFVTALVLFSISMTTILASTGALIGFGSAEKKVLGYFLRAFLVRFSHLTILLFFFLGGNELLAWSSLAASLVFAGVVYTFVYREVLPETLPKDLRRELRRWPGKADRPAKGPE